MHQFIIICVVFTSLIIVSALKNIFSKIKYLSLCYAILVIKNSVQVTVHGHYVIFKQTARKIVIMPTYIIST